VSSLASFGSASAIGLSIGSSSVKIVELKKSGRGWKLLHFGVIQLPDDAVVNREIMNGISVTESIRSLVNQIKLSNKSVCTALSGSAVIIKRMSIEVPKKTDLQDQVFWEAEQYLPFDVSEVVMDYHVLTKGKEAKTDLIFVAAKSTVLDAYTGVIQDAGLNPKIVDTDYFALQTLFEANYPGNQQDPTMIVDIGASSMKLIAVHGGIPVFTKDASIGGKNLTAEIQRHLNLSFNDAETLKTSSNPNELPQEVSDLMTVTAGNFAIEIKRALDIYSASSTGAPITQVLLCGGSSKIPNLSKSIEEVIEIPVQLMNPFNAISYDPGVFTDEYIATISPIAAIPIGLAIRAGS
jgi:type IV pilus assembly protein PilM